MHVRFATGRQHNSIYNFSGTTVRKRTFCKKIHPMTYRNIADPADYLDDHQQKSGLCVPTCISLSALMSDDTRLTEIGKREVKTTNQLLNFHSLLTRKKGHSFISLQHFSLLEDYNSPFPKRLLEKRKNLAQKSGPALNLFRCQVTKTDSATSIHLFAVVLSRFHDDPSYQQIDLVQDNKDLWDTDVSDDDKENERYNRKNFETDITNHVLLILDLAKFLYTHNPDASKRSNGSRRCQFIHRPCLSLFAHEEQLHAHSLICQPFPTKGKIRKRKPRNKILPNHIFENPITGKKQVNSLFFKKSSLKNTIKPVMISSIDTEAFLLDVPPTQRVPNSTTQKIHKIFCYSIAHKSLYNHLPLPRELASPRALIYDHTKTNERQFMLQLMLQLRQDTARQTRFITSALNQDQGVPSYSSLPNKVKTAFDLASHCAFCGSRFYSRKVSKKNVSAVSSFKKFQLRFQVSRILPCKDHSHLNMASSLEA